MRLKPKGRTKIWVILALAAGLFAAAPYSPLEWAEIIAAREYRE